MYADQPFIATFISSSSAATTQQFVDSAVIANATLSLLALVEFKDPPCWFPEYALACTPTVCCGALTVAREALAGVAESMAWLDEHDEDAGVYHRTPQQQAAMDAAFAKCEEELIHKLLAESRMTRAQARHYSRGVIGEARAERAWKEQKPARTRQRCLAAIGNHIEGARWPAWLGGLVTKPLLWQFAAAATRSCGASGEQMARQYLRMQRDQSEQLGEEGVWCLLFPKDGMRAWPRAWH
jgi:hypothetical protein